MKEILQKLAQILLSVQQVTWKRNVKDIVDVSDVK